jgi:pilus assembly protein CpaC
MRLTVLFAVWLGLAWPGSADAQAPVPSGGPVANENVFQVVTPRSSIQITEQFSRIFECANRITMVSGFDPEIVHVDGVTPNRVMVRGEQAGVTTLVLTDEFDNTYTIEVFVAGDVRHVEAYLRQLFPEASVQVVKLKESVVLRGVVTEPDHITEMMDVAMDFYPKVLNQMRVGGVHQVQLNVRVLEVARTKVRQLGFNFLLGANEAFVASRPGSIVTTEDVTTPYGGPASYTFLTDSAIQFAVMGAGEVFNGFVDALRNENLLKILAEPKVVTTSGRPATILSGGEFPILVPQSLGTVTIEWREYGVRMEAVPVVLGNGRLRLDVAPEVSERDFSNSATIQGMVVPGITTRRVNTQVEMHFGETLMIGGLISTRKAGDTSKIPFLGELPWVGAAFRNVRYEMAETELLVLVTPHMVAPLSPDQAPPMGPGEFTDDPTDKELYFDGVLEVPKYGPECATCEPGYPGMGYGPGGEFSGNAGCVQQGPGSQGLMMPAGVSELPPQMGAPAAPATPAMVPSDPVLQPSQIPSGAFHSGNGALPNLPPLPGHDAPATQPMSSANQPAHLGLIDPFHTPVRSGSATLVTEKRAYQPATSPTTQPAAASTRPQSGSAPLGRLMGPQTRAEHSTTQLSAPRPASIITQR